MQRRMNEQLYVLLNDNRIVLFIFSVSGQKSDELISVAIVLIYFEVLPTLEPLPSAPIFLTSDIVG